MLINRRLMIEEQSFIRAVRHSHDVDVPEFRPGFAPVAMRQDMMSPTSPPVSISRPGGIAQ